jgi:DUF4097 and DUF4098 domain-containing protein YvlB
MSSPVPIPAAPPRRRSLASAVVLIIIGLVFLLSTTGVLHGLTLARLFARFWPVLIIIWGVVKLVEHQQAQRIGARSSGIGVGGAFLLAFLICAGLIATQASKVNWKGIHDEIGWDEGDFGSWFGESYSYNDELKEPFPADGSLHVVCDRGAVTIQSSDENQIKVSVEKKVHADNQQDADKYNTGTKPTISVNDKIVTLNANTQGAGDHGVSADLTISIPRKAPVVVSSRHGDVNISSRTGDLDISTQRGDVTVDDITGNVNLSLQHSSGKVSNVSGNVAVEGRVDDIAVTDVKGSARLNGEFMESIKISKIGKTVVFKSSRTDLEFAKLDGDLDLDSGDLRASSFQGPSRLITRAKDIQLDKLSGDLRLQDSDGGVRIHVSKVGNLEVDNRNGDIQLSLPAQAGFRIEAQARNGEIQSDWGELKVDNAHDQATASGSVGNGVGTIRLNNQHGTIEIRKGALDAELPAPPAPPAPKAPRVPAPSTGHIQESEN